MTRPTFALAIPHASWIPERALMMTELREALGVRPHDFDDNACKHGTEGHSVTMFGGSHCGPSSLAGSFRYEEFTEREHWSSWFLKILRWAGDADASHLLVLQDDVEVAPHFWEALSAMVTAWPGEFIGLAATHSLGPEIARRGQRSYFARKVVGWGYVIPIAIVGDLYFACTTGGLLEAFRAQFPTDGEDTMIAAFLKERRIPVRCPVPTIVDHLFCKSTNEGFDVHTHRRSTVTWRGFSPEDMACPSWWQTHCAELPPDDWRRCWYCGKREEAFHSPDTGCGLCAPCVLGLVGSRLGLTVKTGGG